MSAQDRGSRVRSTPRQLRLRRRTGCRANGCSGCVTTLTDLAGVACLSPYHFSRSFKRSVGVGPQRYVIQSRLERAKTLLRRTHPAPRSDRTTSRVRRPEPSHLDLPPRNGRDSRPISRGAGLSRTETRRGSGGEPLLWPNFLLVLLRAADISEHVRKDFKLIPQRAAIASCWTPSSCTLKSVRSVTEISRAVLQL